MPSPHDPRTGAADAPVVPAHQPVVDAFTDVPQAEGERPVSPDVDADDMFVQGGE